MTTFTEEYRDVVDKSGWGGGPWDDEPDKAAWVDEAPGLDCMIVRGPMGALCGYVGVPEGHPWHGKSYDDCLEGNACKAPEHEGSHWACQSPDGTARVHGGLTFADACSPSEKGPGHGICHIEQPGRPQHVWWFGFDCAHAYDLVPKMLAFYRDRGMRRLDDEVYRAFPYVVSEVTQLASQLAAVSA